MTILKNNVRSSLSTAFKTDRIKTLLRRMFLGLLNGSFGRLRMTARRGEMS